MKAPSLPLINLPKSLVGFSRGLVALSLLGSLVLGSSKTQAADGTWNLDGNGNWDLATTAPWLNGIVASGIGSNAYFNTLNISANTTVTLTESLTIGNLYFGDVPAGQNWTLARTGAAELTLQTSSGGPLITIDNGTTTISAALAGTQGFTKAGSGTLVLSGSNTLTGGITVSAGTLDIWSASTSNNIDLAAGTILAVSNPNSSSSGNNITTISGNITGSGRINKTNSNSTLVLTGDSTSTGGTTLGDGIIMVGTGLNNGIGTGTLTLNRGALLSTDNNSRTFANTLAMGGNPTLRFGALEGATTGLGNLTFSSTTNVSLGSEKTMTINNNTRVTFKNSWSGNPGWNITKAGTGTLVLDGNITGANGVGLIVNSGTLILNGSKSTVAPVTVNSGGTLAGNSPSMTGVFTLNTGGAISPGDGGIGTLTATNLTWNGEASGSFAQMKFELGNVGNLGLAATSDKLSLGAGILTKGTGSIFAFDFLGTGSEGNTYTLLTFGSTGFSVGDFSYTNLAGGLSGTFTLQGNSLMFSVVPEPQTYVLLAVGLMAVLLVRRKQRA